MGHIRFKQQNLTTAFVIQLGKIALAFCIGLWEHMYTGLVEKVVSLCCERTLKKKKQAMVDYNVY